MTPQERELITTFLEQMQQTRAGQKDPEAEALIAAAVASQPDAAYLLVQRAVGLDYALQAAKADLVKVQAELEQARAAGGNSSAAFMGQGGSWGRSGKTAPVAPVAGAPAQAAFTPAFSSASVARPQAAAAAPAPAPAQGCAWGGMLGTGNLIPNFENTSTDDDDTTAVRGLLPAQDCGPPDIAWRSVSQLDGKSFGEP